MAEIPPPPDELPDGFSLEGDEKPGSTEDHYKRLIALSEVIRQLYQDLLEQRTRLIRDLERIERLLGSPHRIVILGAVGALLGMATYHLIMIIVTEWSG